MNVFHHAMIAIRSIFRQTAHMSAGAATEANTQAILASVDSIKRRGDQFSRLVHGQRGDGPRVRRRKAATNV